MKATKDFMVKDGKVSVIKWPRSLISGCHCQECKHLRPDRTCEALPGFIPPVEQRFGCTLGEMM